ncbi:MAG TPA: GNAT family N-acetyltransferase [Dehalococcoidia bacterium]|nr:GNAT family N-acetyltransferase [Dehalococcoidia bacterium]
MSKAEEAKVTIRRMTRNDIHEVLFLDRIVTGQRRDVIKYEDIASANPGTAPDMSFVAEIDGKLAGFSINRSMYLMVPLTEVCIIHAILVHPDYRGLGIGSKLIQALLKHCQTEGIGTVRALIPRGSKELQAMFERQGFQRSRIVNFDRTFES